MGCCVVRLWPQLSHMETTSLGSGRVPDDATVDVLARRIAAGEGGGGGGADLSACDGFLRGGEADAR